MSRLILRNLRVYFRDKLSVFFSLLSVLLTFLLYLLFLGNVMKGNLPDVPAARSMMDAWIMAGILCISSVTTTMGALSTMVDDRARMIGKDFSASPLPRTKLAASYILSAFAVGVLMTTLGLVLAEAYIALNGGELLGMGALVKMLGMILLSVLSSTTFFAFLFSFFKTNAAVGTASSLVGTLIGFLAGIYIPIGSLPNAVQGIVKVLPVSHSAVLMRQIMMEKPLGEVLLGAPQEAIDGILQELGVRLSIDGNVLTSTFSVLLIAASGVVFFLLSARRMTKKEFL